MRKLWGKPYVCKNRFHNEWRVEFHTCDANGKAICWHRDKADSWQEAYDRALWLTEFYS